MTVWVAPLNLADGSETRSWLALLDQYARDPMGGGRPLSGDARAHLVERLRDVSGFHGAVAWQSAAGGASQAVGLINCFTGFSTFAARPLLNIHDLVVRADRRGERIAQTLLDWAARRAIELRCCKLTLEVLSHNASALAAYERAGFVPYTLDPVAGSALFMQKGLD